MHKGGAIRNLSVANKNQSVINPFITQACAIDCAIEPDSNCNDIHKPASLICKMAGCCNLFFRYNPFSFTSAIHFSCNKTSKAALPAAQDTG